MERSAERPATLTKVRNDLEASALLAALADRGIEATRTGSFTASFQAEAPGLVEIVVPEDLLDEARQALAAVESERGSVDWSRVDVGDPGD